MTSQSEPMISAYTAAPDEGGNRRREVGRFDRLSGVLLEAGPERGLSIFDPGVRGKGERGDPPAALGVEGPDFADEIVTVLFRHPDIADQDIERLLFERLQRRPGVFRGGRLGSAFREDRCKELPRVSLVVYDEDPDTAERRKLTGRKFSGRDPPGLCLVNGALVRQRERHGESRALSGPGARGLDGPAVELHEMARNGEPEPQTTSMRLRAGVHDTEPAENIWELFGRDSLAGVANADLDGGRAARDAHVDATSARREL